MHYLAICQKNNFFYSLPNNDLPFSTPKKIPDFCIKRASSCKGWGDYVFLKENKHNIKYILKSSFSVLLARRPVGVVIFTKPFKRNTKTEKNVKSETKNMKNETNLNSLNFTTSPCGRGIYNVLHPEIQNETKPNEANLKPISETENPSCFQGRTALFQNLFLRNKPNFNDLNITVTSYGTTAYNDLHPKSQNGTNPNKANQSQFRDESINNHLQLSFLGVRVIIHLDEFEGF